MKKGIIALLSTVTGIVIGITGKKIFKAKEITNVSKEIKFRNYYCLLNQWLVLKNKGVSLEKYFLDNDISSIAIYGMGELGGRLYEELSNSCIEVKYGIDKLGDSIYSNIDILSLDDKVENVDAIIVTPVHLFDSIEKDLNNRVTCPIISLEDVVYNIKE